MRWALINSENIVENVVIWDGTDDLFPTTLNIELNENESCGPNWNYIPNGTPRFAEPIIPEEI